MLLICLRLHRPVWKGIWKLSPDAKTGKGSRKLALKLSNPQGKKKKKN